MTPSTTPDTNQKKINIVGVAASIFCGSMSSKDVLPKSLLKGLRSANICSEDLADIQQKLQQRTCASILSYLNLAAVKILATTVAVEKFSEKIDAQQRRQEFSSQLEQTVSVLNGP